MSILPPFLQSGSVVAITCPSGFLPRSHADAAVKTLAKWGFQVEIGQTVGHEWHYFSGTDELRRRELQAFLDNPKIGAILAGRGGYGMSRIIDDLDFTKFQQHPKWIMGFSDITVLHAQIHKLCNVATIHGPMCHGFMDKDDDSPILETLQSMLTGQPVHYVVDGDEHNQPGQVEGVLTGGNLSMLAHLCGSKTQPETTGKILFIEDIGEHLYKIDRMMLTLKRAGILDRLAGLICGAFTQIEDTERPFGMTVTEIIHEKIAGYNYPVAFGFPAGHIKDNYPLMLGRRHQLKVENKLVQLMSL